MTPTQVVVILTVTALVIAAVLFNMAYNFHLL